MSSSFQPPVAQNNAYGAAGGASGNAIDKLAGDIQNLITVMRMEAAQKPHDASLQTRLGALQDLQRIVQSTTLPPDQLEAIKKQVTDLATVTLRASSARNSTPPTHAPPLPPPPQAQPAPYSVAPLPAPAAATATAAPGSVSLDSLLGAGAMAALMGRQGSQNSTPIPPPSAHAAIRSPQPPSAEPYRAPPPPPTQSQNGGGALSLMDQLRAAGLIQTPSQNTPVAAAAPPPPPPSSHTAPSLPTNLAELIASAKSLSSTLAKPSSNGLTAGILERP
jgi:pre-mRNA cleavage complex 2 protein Pcf11